MTNERAKEILDFLARNVKAKNAKYNRFEIEYSSSAIADIARIYGKEEGSDLYIAVDSNGNGMKLSYVEGSTTFSDVLNDMLYVSSRGCKIETKFSGEVFLQAYCTLEQILVEMDLAKTLWSR